MYRLPLTIILVLWGVLSLTAQSPHGDKLKMDCVKCHNPSGWDINYRTLQFDHDKTDYPLEGSHTQTDCKLCHSTLVFDEAPSTECISCHADIHGQSVGNDCVRCHTSETWLVDNIPELHEENGFPLIGAHSNLSCVECHTSETVVRFDRIGNDCISCHQDDYASTQSPNHQTAGFSMDCTECHDPLGFGWDSESINHDFFPLTQGHDIQDCSQCHNIDNYGDISPDCVSCHNDDYTSTQNPNHTTSGFSTDCVACHSTNPGWMPATINHDFFPLTSGHDIQDCAQCHTTANYSDASPDCVACHQNDYDQTNDPIHLAANFPTDCVACHTTNPGWAPATFDHDAQYFPIYTGKHRQGETWNDCVECHANPASYADFTCFTCHLKPEMDDKHKEENGYEYVSTACLECHPNGEN